jgi:hypothetical protein
VALAPASNLEMAWWFQPADLGPVEALSWGTSRRVSGARFASVNAVWGQVLARFELSARGLCRFSPFLILLLLLLLTGRSGESRSMSKIKSKKGGTRVG